MNLAVFMTFGVSLSQWNQIGSLTRELALYNRLSQHFDAIYLITYGNESELSFQDQLAPNIKVLYNSHHLPTFLYSLLIPFLHHQHLKQTSIYKTNQLLGSWSAIVTKLIYHKPLIIRQGYQYSLTLRRKSKFILSLIATFLELISYHLATRIIVTSREQKQYISTRYHTNPSRIIVIPNYVDTDLFKPLEVEKDLSRLLFIGRLDKEKNLYSLVDAIKPLPVHLTLIGSGPLEQSLKLYCVGSNVEFKRSIPNTDLPLEINRSAIYVQPSLYEGNPKTILEAMACGVPVIGTNVNGIKEIISTFKTGVLCDTNSDSIRRYIKILLNDSDLRMVIGAHARNYILSNNSLDIILQKELELYKTICEN